MSGPGSGDGVIAVQDGRPVMEVTPPSAADQLVAVIDRAARDPDYDVDKLERMFSLHEKLRAEQAQQAFAQAFVALQMELPPIEATKIIPDKNGKERSRFTPYVEMMAIIRPLLRKNNFAITRSQSMDANTVTESLTLIHAGGHSKTNTFTVRRGNGPPGTSTEQGDGSAASFALRYALRDALDLVFIGPEKVEDETKLGEALTPEDAVMLRARTQAVVTNEHKFLLWAGVKVDPAEPVVDDHYEKIMSGRLPAIGAELSKRERGES